MSDKKDKPHIIYDKYSNLEDCSVSVDSNLELAEYLTLKPGVNISLLISEEISGEPICYIDLFETSKNNLSEDEGYLQIKMKDLVNVNLFPHRLLLDINSYFDAPGAIETWLASCIQDYFKNYSKIIVKLYDASFYQIILKIGEYEISSDKIETKILAQFFEIDRERYFS